MSAPPPDAMTPETTIGLPPPRRGPGRRLIWLLIALSLPIAALAVAFGVYRLRALQRLDRALAFAARTDPGWNAPSVFQAGPLPARPQDDLVPRMRAVVVALGPTWNPAVAPDRHPPSRQRRYDVAQFLKRRNPRTPLPAGLARRVVADLQAVRLALDEARRFADAGTGFLVPPPTGPAWPRRRARVSQADRDVVVIEELLRVDAAVQAEAGDPDLALADLAALLRLSSYHTVYPGSFQASHRLGLQGETLDLLARVLTQSRPTERGLARIAVALEGQLAENVLLNALRADRAGYDRTLADLADGKITLAQAVGFPGRPLRGYPLPRALIESNRATQLAMLNQAVELARLPVHDRSRAFLVWIKRWGGAISVTNFLAMRGASLMTSLFEQANRVEVRLDVARVAVAAERFRLAHGRWPASATELAPRFLSEIPPDPASGAGPLPVKATADGLIVYALGQDAAGGRGVPNSSVGAPPEQGSDWGLVLPDPERRGLPDGATPLPADVFARERNP